MCECISPTKWDYTCSQFGCANVLIDSSTKKVVIEMKTPNKLHPSLVIESSIELDHSIIFDTRCNSYIIPTDKELFTLNESRWNETQSVCPKAYRQTRAMALVSERVGE